ncbi:thioesterase II family protein [Pseudactinotalea sp. HY158]|uniref:thioesterase II family protein n=1 Tax=Pseudactinotalea sp. HY158 TaxID=2654547 RepID=UPI001E3638A5|nr:thioesterase domain-containing protein [Pseudactinotalea sp. HY158]
MAVPAGPRHARPACGPADRAAVQRSPVSTGCLHRFGPERRGARLLCVPHAGASADAYAPWVRDLGGALELWAVTPAGRRDRADEPLNRDPQRLVTEVVSALTALDERPLFVFGHSMGALIGFEVAAELAGSPHQPRAVIVSGSPAPHIRSRHRENDYTDDDLAESLVDWGGTAQELVGDLELRELLFPPLRADLQLCDRYHRTAPWASPVPLAALAGRDDQVAPPSDVTPWEDYTTDFLGLRTFTGGHFFPATSRREVIDHVVSLAMQVLTRH